MGSQVTATGVASIGIGSVSTGDLGDSFNGYLSSIGSGGANSLSSNNLSTSQNILDSAISQVSTLRGRLGAFQTFTIGSTVNSLGVAYENVSAAESAITDTNFAAETSNLTRDQILSQAATTVLHTANAQPDNVLKFLGCTKQIDSRGGATDSYLASQKSPGRSGRGILFAPPSPINVHAAAEFVSTI